MLSSGAAQQDATDALAARTVLTRSDGSVEYNDSSRSISSYKDGAATAVIVDFDQEDPSPPEAPPVPSRFIWLSIRERRV